MKSIEFSFRFGDRVTNDRGEVHWRSVHNEWPGLVSFDKDEEGAIDEAVRMFRERLTYAMRSQHPEDFVWKIEPRL